MVTWPMTQRVKVATGTSIERQWDRYLVPQNVYLVRWVNKVERVYWLYSRHTASVCMTRRCGRIFLLLFSVYTKLKSAYNKCIKKMFGYTSRDSMTGVFFDLSLPTLDTVVLLYCCFACLRGSIGTVRAEPETVISRAWVQSPDPAK